MSVSREPNNIVLRTHEVAIKGANRVWFERRLMINVGRLLKRELGREIPLRVSRAQGRLLVQAPWNDSTKTALSRAFGITGFSQMKAVTTDKQVITDAAIQEFKDWSAINGMPKTFSVRTRRSDKVFPETSQQLDTIFGGAIHDEFPELKVDLNNPDFTLGIELRHKLSYVWSEKFPGPGGLPVGTNGAVVALLSGGIDSPVAALQMMRRGTSVHFLHFHGAPFVGEESLEKVSRLARLINRYQPKPLPLWVIPFGEIQEKIARVTDPKLRTILYRRMMLRIAAKAAVRVKAQALVTGESLGQVASQTLTNLATIDRVASLPVLRPLIGTNKDEIIDLAKKWGTFETSIEPAGDCCTLFADRHPNLKASLDVIEAQEAKFPSDEFIEEALTKIHRKKY